MANDRKAFDECREHTVGENVHFTFPLGSKSSAVGARSRATGVARLSDVDVLSSRLGEDFDKLSRAAPDSAPFAPCYVGLAGAP